MNDLKAITEINEEIKIIISVAENNSLIAANAMLAASQRAANAGSRDMVAYELRVYSEKMTAAMQALSALVNWQAEINASKQRRRHNLALLNNAGACGELARACIAPIYISNRTDVTEIERFIVSQVHDLLLTVRRTEKQCATSLLIARSTDIESAPEDAMTPALRRIVQDVEAAICDIAVRVNKLESRLTEAGL
jgi:uncharacterized protein YydD (DUF2326 family)